MEQINANLIVAPTRLNRPLPTLYARKLHSFTALLTNVPSDVTSLVLRVFKTNGTQFFDIPCSRLQDGSAKAYCIGTCFPDNGSSKYEIHGYDAQGNVTALGVGYVLVEDFSISGNPITPDGDVVLDYIRDRNGVMHVIKAVPDGEGGYTTIVDDSTTEA